MSAEQKPSDRWKPELLLVAVDDDSGIQEIARRRTWWCARYCEFAVIGKTPDETMSAFDQLFESLDAEFLVDHIWVRTLYKAHVERMRAHIIRSD